jgi:hypothetical protein
MKTPDAVQDPATPPAAFVRVQQSRERLRAALLAPPAGRPSPSAASSAFASFAAFPSFAPLWPLAQSVLSSWWARQPAQHLAQLAHGLLQAWARPLAARHPLTLLAGAMVAGAVLMAVRPWRWLPRRALRAGLLPLLWRELARQPPPQGASRAGQASSSGSKKA